jgi:hypothetical protein
MTLEPLVALVAKVRDESLVLPQSWTIGGKRKKGDDRPEGRITAKRLEAQDFVLAPSLVCVTLQQINIEAALLQDAMREEEWFMVEPIPAALDMYFPRHKNYLEDAYRAIAEELRSFWAEEWTGVIARQAELKLTGKKREEDSAVQRKRITDHIKAELGQYADAPEIQQAIVVEIARQTYRRRHTEARLNQDGTKRSYPDGLLWNKYVGNIYIDALKEAGLTGLYVPVHFDRWSAALKNTTCEVEIMNYGLVRRPEDNFLVGHVGGNDPIRPGVYQMQYGLICVQAPSEELIRSSNQVLEEQILAGNPNGKEEEVSFS